MEHPTDPESPPVRPGPHPMWTLVVNTMRRLRIVWLRSIRWTAENIDSKNYELLVSIVIGVAAGLAAALMKGSVFLIEHLLIGEDPTSGNVLYVLYPLIGIILASLFVRYYLRKPLDTGLSNLIYAITAKKVKIPPFETYAHIVTSALTVGFGGSVGLEAPIVRTGSAVGANLAQSLRVGRRKQTLFLACGTAAGMASIFNSPVAGVLFSFEVLLAEIALDSFIPLLISAASGAVIGRILFPDQVFFLATDGWRVHALPFYILLGMSCGLLSAYMIRVNLKTRSFIQSIADPKKRLLAGGLALGVLIFLMPPLYGEGYNTVNSLLDGTYFKLVDHSLFYWLSDQAWFLIVFAVLILLTKVVASAVTIAAGGNGGIFAPSMFIGALTGFAFSHAVNQTGLFDLNEANFVAVAMAGILSGVIKAPLTGIFLIAEITGGYELFVPLMLVSAISYFVTYYFEPQSIFTKLLYQRGLWAPVHERDKNLLRNMQVEELVETNFAPLKPEQTLGAFVQVIAGSRRNVFPVVDHENVFLGIVLLDDVRPHMFKSELYSIMTVKDMMHLPPAIVEWNEPMEKVMDKFEHHKAWNLPVVKNGRYLGFVSKSTIFNRYRELLQEHAGGM